MTQQRKTYTREFKLEAIRLWQTTEKSARQVEDDLGIARGLLYRWKGQLENKGEDAFTGKGRMTPTEEEIRRLQRELEIVKQERDILHMPWRAVPGKKAVGIFSRPK
jgi:transposase